MLYTGYISKGQTKDIDNILNYEFLVVSCNGWGLSVALFPSAYWAYVNGTVQGNLNTIRLAGNADFYVQFTIPTTTSIKFYNTNLSSDEVYLRLYGLS